MRKIFIITFLLLCLCTDLRAASKIVYTKNDSIRIECIAAEAFKQPKDTNLVLFIARKFLGIPYVAQTLEKGDSEQLIINTTQLDCTTLVENVMAMYLCVKNNKLRFRDFCDNIRRIRYEGGKVSYPTRLHYFTSWIESNTSKGFVKEVSSPTPPFSASQIVKVNYMSLNSSKYPRLSGNKAMIKQIAKTEQTVSGKKYKYIPKRLLSNSSLLKKAVADGDILAIVTNKKGLDISHVGYAVWHRDGLHLLNASSIHHKVVDEPMTLYQYMQKHPSQLGIRVIRLK